MLYGAELDGGTQNGVTCEGKEVCSPIQMGRVKQGGDSNTIAGISPRHQRRIQRVMEVNVSDKWSRTVENETC